MRATAFMETWGQIMGKPLQASGKVLVFGQGDNPINFGLAADVATLTARAATDPGLLGRSLSWAAPTT